jgi:YidC/Oxa1 family membrane protein insertase
MNFLAKPLGSILSYIFNYIPDVGWSIIVLTVGVSVLLFPLTLKQTRATRAFSLMQPEMKRIQTEHKEDPAVLQAEMGRLQKEHGASPAGCIGPMIVQMPIWFGLFRLLQSFVEIKNKKPNVVPKNLFLDVDSSLYAAIENGNTLFSGMDLTLTPSEAFSVGSVLTVLPYVLFIIAMVATQYFQQVYAQVGQPSSENAQVQMTQNITKFLPVFFGAIAWNFTSGLIVYWATSNLFRLGQQIAIVRIDGRPPQAGDQQVEQNEKEKPAAPKSQGSAKKRQRRRRK